MSSEWRSGRLGDFIELKRGYDLPQVKRRRGAVPLVSSSGVSDSHDQAMVRGPGVVTGRYGTIGQVFFIEQDFWPLNTTLYVRDFKGNDPKFISYFLRTLDFFAYSDKAAVPGVNRNHVHEASVVLPDPETQEAIAACLGALDDRIALLRETNATLEAIAQALFKSWFVDFDPVRAKSQGLAPAGMDEATAALFPASDDEWRRYSSRPFVSELIDAGALLIGDGYRAKNDELGLPGLPFVRAGDLDAGQITPTKDHLSERSVESAVAKIAKPGDTAFTSKGTIGRFAYVDADAGEAVYSPQVCFWRSLQHDIVDPAYLHYWMKSDAFKAQVDMVRGQAAIMDYVSLGDQRRMRLDLPPPRLQSCFADNVQALLSRISCNRAMAAGLAHVRDTLLPRLISGQLRLSEAEQATAESA
jgi:type I restriction enzyme S subunit